MRRQTRHISLRITEETALRLERMAPVVRLTPSEILRKALDVYLDAYYQTAPMYQKSETSSNDHQKSDTSEKA